MSMTPSENEFTASSFTHTVPFGAFDNCPSAQECDEADPRWLTGDFGRQTNFGMIDVDWDRRTVSLRRGESNQIKSNRRPISRMKMSLTDSERKSFNIKQMIFQNNNKPCNHLSMLPL
jgi:hypothetical protein